MRRQVVVWLTAHAWSFRLLSARLKQWAAVPATAILLAAKTGRAPLSPPESPDKDSSAYRANGRCGIGDLALPSENVAVTALWSDGHRGGWVAWILGSKTSTDVGVNSSPR